MPTAADRLSQQHQREVSGIAGGVASVVAATAMGADPAAIGTWYWGVIDGLISRVQMGHAQARRSAMEFLPRHAALSGAGAIQMAPASSDVAAVRKSLEVTGPVAFKTAIGAGADTDQAIRSMATQMSGAAQRHVRAGDRDTVERTAVYGQGVVGWRRVLVGKSCGFCAMLASRGSVYVNQKRASFRGDGNAYHDHCDCYAEPLYSHQEEPAYVRQLQRQWVRVTAGKSGRDARIAWRRHWDRVSPPPQLRLAASQPSGVAGVAGQPFAVRQVLVDAKTVGQVQWAFLEETRRIRGVMLDPRDVDFSRASVQTMREHAEGILRGLERFPDAHLRGASVADLADARYAQTSGPDVMFSRRWSSTVSRQRYLQSLKGDVDAGFHFAGSESPITTALHEFGHILDFGGDQLALRRRVKQIVADYASEAGIDVAEAAARISRYSAEHVSELIGEAFADVMVNGERASILSRRVFAEIEDSYRAAGGTVRGAGGALASQPLGLSGVADRLRFTATRDEARAILADVRTVGDLREVARLTGVKVPSRATRKQVEDEITQWTIGRDLVESGITGLPLRVPRPEWTPIPPKAPRVAKAAPAKAAKATPAKAAPGKAVTAPEPWATDLAAQLRTAASREEARALIDAARLNGRPLTVPRLRELAKAADVATNTSMTRTKLVDELVQWTTGRRLTTEAILRRPAGTALSRLSLSIDTTSWQKLTGEARARARQAVIDVARPRQELLSQVLEDLGNGVDAAVIRRRLEATTRRLNVQPEVSDRLLRALDSGGGATAAEIRVVEVENAIREAYRNLPHSRDGWVGLADLRDNAALSGLPRAEVDDAIRRMYSQERGVRVSVSANRKALTPRDRAATIRIGEDNRDIFSLDDPSPRPVPGAATGDVAAEVDRIAAESGLTLVGRASETLAMDTRTMRAVEGSVPAGRPVTVVRPGARFDPGDGEVVLGKAVVEVASDAEAKAFRAAGENAAKREAARTRQAAIDAVTPKAQALADLAEVAGKRGDLAAELDTLARLKALPAVDITSLRRAVKTGDPEKLQRALDRVATKHGARTVTRAGDVTTMREGLEVIGGGELRAGAQVRVVRPGVEVTVNGETVVLSRPLVREVTPDEQFTRYEAYQNVRVTSRNLPLFDPERPLAFFGDRIVIEQKTVDSLRHLADLEALPERMLTRLRDEMAARGGAVYVGAKSVPELDSMGHLRGVTPRGWAPGQTWDMVPGTYDPRTGSLLLGGGGVGHGAESLALHEGAHGIDYLMHGTPAERWSSRGEEWARLWADAGRLLPAGSVRDYFTRAGNPSGWLEEAWAESFAVWAALRRTTSAAKLREAVARATATPGASPTALRRVGARLVKFFESIP